MSYYRIKIEEKFNGEKLYIPQYGTPKLRMGFFCWISVEWQNIIPACSWFILSDKSAEAYNTEEKALQTIEAHKQYVAKKHGEKIKLITYKTISNE